MIFTLLVLAILVIVFVIVVALQPSDFRITRSATIAAPPAVVFAQVNDLHKFQTWSPWAKIDPAAKTTYEGPPAGSGAVFRWDGNGKVGVGTMTVTESRPAERVAFRLDFLRPFKGTNTAVFTFKPEGGKTAVTWTMTGKSTFIPRAICLFMSMDKMVGGQFEQGLASLKSIAEAAAGK
ncbi:MAG: SRPBCC family protein [Opitutaceae bacterium]|nr:SRPBCC family protein [Opitutaceae bacterium]